MRFVDQMMDDANNKGIFLYVDSPGGTVYHSDELYLKLMEYKEKTNRPIYAYFANQACSGAYYISMAAMLGVFICEIALLTLFLKGHI